MKPAVLMIVAAAFALSAALYTRLPETMPIHWNLQGQADRSGPRLVAAFLLPMVMAGICVLFAILPRISPRGYEIDAGSRAYRAILFTTMAFLLALHAATLATALGLTTVTTLMPLLLGALFVILGNYLTTVRRNFFIGIRTPWTLANDEVWFRTHRLGGPIFMAAGVMLIAGVLLLRPEQQHSFLLAIVIGAALIPFVYSYIVYRRLDLRHGKGDSSR